MSFPNVETGCRRWHDSIRQCASLLAVQQAQGFITPAEAERRASDMGVTVIVLHRELKTNGVLQ